MPLVAPRPDEMLARLRGLPAVARWLLRLLLTAGFVAGPAAAIANTLAVGTITEAWPWLLWGEPYLELAERMYFGARPAMWVATSIVGWFAFGWLLTPRVAKPGPLWRRGLRFAFGVPGLVVLLIACSVLAGPAAVGAVRLGRTFPPRSDAVIQDNCGKCHSPYRPQHFIKTEDHWRRTVKRMRERNGAKMSDKTAERAIQWLSDYRSFDDGWMFRAKCLRCHGEHHLREMDRTEEEWNWIVDRVAWLSPFAYRVDQRDQIKRHLATSLAKPAPAEGSPKRKAWRMRVELANACNPCHSIGLILEDGALDNAEDMVRRMSEKDPDLVPPDKVEEYSKALLDLPQDEDEFWRLFPHDLLLDLEPRTSVYAGPKSVH
jgi:hypothetical protein